MGKRADINRLFLILVALSLYGVAFAQDTLLVFDRPGVADSPYLPESKSILIESGYGFESGAKPTDLLNPGFMFRKTIFRNTELRLAYNTIPQSFRYMNLIDSYSGKDLSAGFKRKLFNEKGLRPEAAVIINSYYRLALHHQKKLQSFTWETQLLFQNNFSKHLALNYNVGFIQLTNGQNSFINQSTCLNINLTDYFSLFVENFNYADIKNNTIEFSYDAGIVFLILDKIQFDLSFIANHDKSKNLYGTLLAGFSIKI